MKRNSVAVNDDVTIVEPAEKTVKKEEVEDPSYEVLELRQKVARLEKDYQGACRIANEYESQLQEYKGRVESLENLLDAKPVMTSSEEAKGLMGQLRTTTHLLEGARRMNGDLQDKMNTQSRNFEELQKVSQSRLAKLSVTMFELEEARRMNDGLLRKINELKCEYEELRKSTEHVVYVEHENEANELMMKLCKTRNELEASKLTSQKLQRRVNALTEDVVNEVTNELNEKLSKTMFELEEECRKNEELQTINNALTGENEELRRAKERDEKEAKKQMRNLSSMSRNKLEEANVVNEELQQDNNELLRRLAESGQLPKVGHSCEASVPNIFNLCPFVAPQTFSFSNVVKMLRSAYFPSDPEWMENYKQAVKNNILACNLCAEPAPMFMGTAILEHFFSRNHTNKIRVQNGTVSLAAFEYWMEKFNEIPKPKGPESGVIMLDKDVPD